MKNTYPNNTPSKHIACPDCEWFLNTNSIADLRQVKDIHIGDACPDCGTAVQEFEGILMLWDWRPPSNLSYCKTYWDSFTKGKPTGRTLDRHTCVVCDKDYAAPSVIIIPLATTDTPDTSVPLCKHCNYKLWDDQAPSDSWGSKKSVWPESADPRRLR